MFATDKPRLCVYNDGMMNISNRTYRFRGFASLGVVGCLLLTSTVFGQDHTRRELTFPDVYGYVTMKCDFHMHTVFSDGLVWPTIRVQEAWRDGLDAIAITDHIEYHPHKADVSTNYARTYDIAKPAADSLGLLLVRAAEITRPEPPGHLNALFLEDIGPLCTPDYHDAVKAAADQGAFLFWNHPGWKQPGNKSVWYKEQGEFYEKGWLRGLEIVNGPDYDPIVHQWAVDKNLTPMGNSDVHDPIDMVYDGSALHHRPVTLVFASAKSLDALKEGLMERRTVIWSSTNLFGPSEYLSPIFEKSVRVMNSSIAIKGKGSATLNLYNASPCEFTLRSLDTLKGIKLPSKLVLPPGRTVACKITVTDPRDGQQTLELPFKAMNLHPAPGETQPVEIRATVHFTP